MFDTAPDENLLDNFIEYADDQRLSLEEAALLIAKYAQQRVPEYKIEQGAAASRNKVRDEIGRSMCESWLSVCSFGLEFTR